MTDEVAATAFPQHVNKNVDTAWLGSCDSHRDLCGRVSKLTMCSRRRRLCVQQGFHARTPACECIHVKSTFLNGKATYAEGRGVGEIRPLLSPVHAIRNVGGVGGLLKS